MYGALPLSHERPAVLFSFGRFLSLRAVDTDSTRQGNEGPAPSPAPLRSVSRADADTDARYRREKIMARSKRGEKWPLVTVTGGAFSRIKMNVSLANFSRVSAEPMAKGRNVNKVLGCRCGQMRVTIYAPAFL